LIGALARDLMTTTPMEDLHVFTAEDTGALMGSIMFSRMRYPEDPRAVFLLSPVAVMPDHQSKGVGQTLIKSGLATLRTAGVDVALTYGDPEYYRRVGFSQVSQTQAAPPVPLQHPHGWQGQTLNGATFTPLKGPSTCVPALQDRTYW